MWETLFSKMTPEQRSFPSPVQIWGRSCPRLGCLWLLEERHLVVRRSPSLQLPEGPLVLIWSAVYGGHGGPEGKAHDVSGL